MISIENIGVYIPEGREYNLKKSYDGVTINENFVRDKVGFISTARMGADEETSDMCCKAFDALMSRAENLSASDIECICLCTHNGDFQMPHTSAIIQDKLGLDNNCAAFDIGLACSGYVHALNILQGFMELNGFSTGVIFTCDPYSKVLNPNDKNADLLLGDGYAVEHAREIYNGAERVSHQGQGARRDHQTQGRISVHRQSAGVQFCAEGGRSDDPSVLGRQRARR